MASFAAREGKLKGFEFDPFTPRKEISQQETKTLIGDLRGSILEDFWGLVKKTPRRPNLNPTAPPRGASLRSRDPFDFFGTLFTTPATSGLAQTNSITQPVV